jgi:molecular chaperone HscB
MERDAGVLVRLEEVGRLAEDLAVEEGGALGADGDDANVPCHGASRVLAGPARGEFQGRPAGLDSGVSADPFDTLGLEARFDLSQAAIDRAYFARSAAVHPDLAAGSSDAAARMAELNRAKGVLSSPERRADALLLRFGGPSREEHKQLPAAFLAEMMEVREQIEHAMGSPRDVRERERGKWQLWADEERANAIAEVGTMFKGLGAHPSADALRAIRTRLNAWRYIERLIEQLDPDYNPATADFADG